MWELNHKEDWAPKNWWFWTVMLEKTLEGLLDKEVKPVDRKGNQPWIFIGRTDAEAKAPILWLPDAKNQLIFKHLMPGKIEGRRRRSNRGWDSWMASPSQWFEQTLGDSENMEACCDAVHGVRKSWIELSNWTTKCSLMLIDFFFGASQYKVLES